MINFTHINVQKVFSISAIVLSGLLLQACGGQRDESFDGNSSSSSSRGASVSIKQLGKGDDPITDVAEEGIQTKILDSDTFETYWDKYTDDTHESVDFDKGQVLLVDLGNKSTCDRKITLKTYAAYQESVNSVVVELTYKDADKSSTSSSSSSASSSSCSSTLETQPYYFFYIETRDTIIVDENVN